MQFVTGLYKISFRGNIATSFRKISQVSTLKDSFGRSHDYLRVSLTERCNLRCRYCMPEGGVELTDVGNTLSLLETKRLLSIFVASCGIKKIRLTGGEPTIDSKLKPVLEHLMELKGSGRLHTIAMTTNGLTLKSRALSYRNFGLDVINISLDSLRPNRFKHMSRRDGWKLVNEGINKALEVRFERVKLNCVVIRGFNDDELVDFSRLALDRPIEVRFIEFMPFMGNNWDRKLLVPFQEMLNVIRSHFPRLVPIETDPNDTSKLYRQKNMLGSIGFISSLTNNFCSGCNRLRLTSDGNLKVCLFDRNETSLRDLIRNGATDTEIVRAIKNSLGKKKREHAGMTFLNQDVSRPMIKIAKRMFHGSTFRCLADADYDQSSSRPKLSHLNRRGEAEMVNVGAKGRIKRVAIARGEICVGIAILSKLLDGSLGSKGDVICVAKIAGIMGAKATSRLIPMCHLIPLDHIQIDIRPRRVDGVLIVEAKVEAEHKTGVEMESLSAVSITLLTIYDMCKSSGLNMTISNIRLIEKHKQQEQHNFQLK